MEIVFVSGSHRDSSESARLALRLSDVVKTIDSSVKTSTVELVPETLPMWSPKVFSDKIAMSQVSAVMDVVKRADALVLMAPEWGGMAPAALKNFLLFCGADHVAFKPALIAGVSASRGGAFPITDLRSFGYKNNRLLMIPEHLILRDCASLYTDSEPKSDDERYLRKRVSDTLRMLIDFTEQSASFAQSDALKSFLKSYPNGMS